METKVQKYLPVIGVLILVGLGGLYSSISKDHVEKYGVIGIGQITSYKSRKNGSSYEATVFVGNNEVYIHVDPADCGNSCIGRYFFVKFLRNNADKNPKFYKDKPVPQCLFDSLKYFPLWRSVPNCSNYKDSALLFIQD